RSLSPFLADAASAMGSNSTLAIINGYLGPVREPWSDILWGRLIGSLLAGRPAEEAEPLARQLLEETLSHPGQAGDWFVERFGATADQLKTQPARELAERLLQRLADPAATPKVEALCSCLLRVAARLDSTSANQVAQNLLA